MPPRTGRKKGGRGARRGVSLRVESPEQDARRQTKRVRFQSPPSASDWPVMQDAQGYLSHAGSCPTDGDFGQSISSADNRFDLLQTTLPDVVFGEESGSGSDGQGGEGSVEAREVIERTHAQSLPDVLVGAESDSGGEGGYEEGSFLSNTGPSPFLPPVSLPSETVGEEGGGGPAASPKQLASPLPLPNPSPFLPREAFGEESDASDEDHRETSFPGLHERRSWDTIPPSPGEDVPQVVVQLASSPERQLPAPLSPQLLAGLFDTINFDHTAASTPPSSETPSTHNTPSIAGIESLPPVPSFSWSGATPEGLQTQLSRAHAERAVLTGEVEVISAAEEAANRMQQMALPSLPRSWNAYQYGLAMRGQQAKGIWTKMWQLNKNEWEE